jgi:hypothetical protein
MTEPQFTDELREQLGRHVREEWIDWASEQPSTKPSWLVPWEELSEPDREVDRRIGEALYNRGLAAKHAEIEWLTGDGNALRAEFDEAADLARTYAGDLAEARAQVAELTRERDQLLASLDEELTWLKQAQNPDRAEMARAIGFEDAVQTVRQVFEAGRPPAQEAGEPHRCHDACPCEGNPSYRAHAEHPKPTVDCPWCPPVEVGEPPAPRVWRVGDPEPPADVALLEASRPSKGARYLRRTEMGNWWFVGSLTDPVDPGGPSSRSSR